MHYLPLPAPFMSGLAVLIAALAALFHIGVLRFAYRRLGVSSTAVLLLLLGSLVGSYVNIPIFDLPEERLLEGRVIEYYGMQYVVPHVVDWPGTVLAVNLGGAVIPVLLSLYLLLKYESWLKTIFATACVALVCHRLAQPVPGLGIAISPYIPPLATALIAYLVSSRHCARLAYISGSLGTLIGADLLNLGKIRGLGAPVASIGGAGSFDAVFLTGLVAVLLTSLVGGSENPDPKGARSVG